MRGGYRLRRLWIDRTFLIGNDRGVLAIDEEIDGLGFQLKEWPWHVERAQLLTDLCQGRSVACDTPIGACKSSPRCSTGACMKS